MTTLSSVNVAICDSLVVVSLIRLRRSFVIPAQTRLQFRSLRRIDDRTNTVA